MVDRPPCCFKVFHCKADTTLDKDKANEFRYNKMFTLGVEVPPPPDGAAPPYKTEVTVPTGLCSSSVLNKFKLV
jgi:hypothetical protein